MFSFNNLFSLYFIAPERTTFFYFLLYPSRMPLHYNQENMKHLNILLTVYFYTEFTEQLQPMYNKGSKTGIPTMWETWNDLKALALTWYSLCCCYYVGSKLVNRRSMFFCPSVI